MTTQPTLNGTQASSHGYSPGGPIGGGISPASRPRLAIEDPLSNVRVLFGRWRFVSALVVIGMLLGWVNHLMAEDASLQLVEIDHYQAAHILVLDNNIPATQRTLSVRNLNLLGKRLTIGAVPDAVAASVGITSTEAAQQVRVLIRSDSESLDIIAIAETPELAEELADTYARELLADLERTAEAFSAGAIEAAQQRLDEAEANLRATRSQLATARQAGDDATVSELEQDEQQHLNARVDTNAELLDARADGVPIVPLLSLDAADGTATVISEAQFDRLVDRAVLGDNIMSLFGDEVEDLGGNNALSAVSSRLPGGALPRVGFGAFLGLVLAAAIVSTAARLDNRVRSKRQVEDVLDLPVIAEIPELGRLERKQAARYSQEHPRSGFAEQHRMLASMISYARATRQSKEAQVVMVTSPSPSEGKTTTVANLAAVIAEPGDEVLLVNCDFRRPRLHVMTGSDYRPKELTSTYIPEIELIANVVDDDHALPSEVIAAQRSVLREARKVYDLVIVDTAPVLATNDAVELLDLVDDVVLVARAGKTNLEAADRAAEILERRNAHILGVAITAIDSRYAGDYYYYGSYYEDSKVSDRDESSMHQNFEDGPANSPPPPSLFDSTPTRSTYDYASGVDVREPVDATPSAAFDQGALASRAASVAARIATVPERQH